MAVLCCAQYLHAPQPTLAVIDNGCGMNTEELSKWATFKYSRFVKAPAGQWVTVHTILLYFPFYTLPDS